MAFAEVSSEEQVQKAIKALNHKIVGGYLLAVKPANRKSVKIAL